LGLAEQQGMTVAQIAQRMKLTDRRVERLLKQERDRRDLERYRCDEIPVEEIQRLFEKRKREDPTLNLSKLAEILEYESLINFERLLGYAPSAATTKRGKRYPAKYRTTISVEEAAAIVHVLGYAPHEVPGL
jgi:hypothetical protein